MSKGTRTGTANPGGIKTRLKNRFFFFNQFVMGTSSWYFYKYWIDLDIRGIEFLKDIPRGACVFVPNHKSFVDHFIILAGCIRAGRSDLLPIRTMVRSSIYHNVFLRPLLASLGAYPAQMRQEITKALAVPNKVLKAGGSVGIYPEGGIKETIGMFKRGVGYLLRMNPGIVAIPVAIGGTERFKFKTFPRRGTQVLLSFGKPFIPDPTHSPEEIAEEIRQKIVDLYDSFCS